MTNYQFKPTGEQLLEIRRSHEAWLNSEDGGKCATLYGANLYGADLSNANLSGADLPNANLSGADLSNANLSGADLSNANLRYANLYGAGLSNANLHYANLYGAGLSNANLREADLGGCIMNWNSHELIAERLRQSYGSYKWIFEISAIKGAWGGCWDNYLNKLPSEFIAWALPHVRTWVQEGDELPDELSELLDKSEEDKSK